MGTSHLANAMEQLGTDLAGDVGGRDGVAAVPEDGPLGDYCVEKEDACSASRVVEPGESVAATGYQGFTIRKRRRGESSSGASKKPRARRLKFDKALEVIINSCVQCPRCGTFFTPEQDGIIFTNGGPGDEGSGRAAGEASEVQE